MKFSWTSNMLFLFVTMKPLERFVGLLQLNCSRERLPLFVVVLFTSALMSSTTINQGYHHITCSFWPETYKNKNSIVSNEDKLIQSSSFLFYLWCKVQNRVSLPKKSIPPVLSQVHTFYFSCQPRPHRILGCYIQNRKNQCLDWNHFINKKEDNYM